MRDAVRVLLGVIEGHHSLKELTAQRPLSSQDKHICFGVCRWYDQLNALLAQLLPKPLRSKDRDITVILLIGLFQVNYSHHPIPQSIHGVVSLCQAVKKPWAKGLVNGVLREFVRQQSALIESLPATAQYSHPLWLIQMIQAAWPDDWSMILDNNNQQAPMHCRINASRTTRDAYLAGLQAKGIEAVAHPYVSSAVTITKPCSVRELPGFDAGELSVQDVSAQCAASLLDLSSGLRVLDACSAPGGKSMHILEQVPDAELWCLDSSASRLSKVDENLKRIGQTARLQCVDAKDTASWYDGKPFDRILLDAPCSATGVIRRHPDIKCLRKESDMPVYPVEQLALLSALWPTLRKGGLLVYATCSILPAENDEVIQAFLASVPDARIDPIDAPWGRVTAYGRQVLPGQDTMDGFYYARLRRLD